MNRSSAGTQRVDFEFDEGKPTGAKQYEFHSLTESLSLTENFVYATQDAQILESMERQEKIHQKRLSEIETEFSKRSGLLSQAKEALAVDEQHLFEFSHIKAAEIAEIFATEEQLAVEKIESVVQGQSVRTKHYQTQLSSFRQAIQQIKHELSVGQSLKANQEKEAAELATAVSTLRIKDVSLNRLNNLGRNALIVAAQKLHQVKNIEQKHEDRLVVLRARRDEVLSKLEKMNMERITILDKVNEIRSGIIERRSKHRDEVNVIQVQVDAQHRESDNMLRSEKKSLNQLRVLEERTLTQEIDQNCAILAELQIAENQNAEAKAAKDADLAQVEETQSSSADELREAEEKLEAVKAELAQAMAEAEESEANQAEELDAVQTEAENLEKRLVREQNAEVKASKASVKKIRARHTKLQQTAGKLSQYAPGEDEQSLIDEIVEEHRVAQQLARKEQEVQEQARLQEEEEKETRLREEAVAKKADVKKQNAEARAAEKRRRKAAEEEKAQAEETARVAKAQAEAAEAKAAEEERVRAAELEKIRRETAEIEAARAELEAVRQAKAKADAEEQAHAEEERVRQVEEERVRAEEKEQHTVGVEEDEHETDEPPRKIANVTKGVRSTRKPKVNTVVPVKLAPVKQAAPVPSVRKQPSAKEAAPMPRSSSNKAPIKSAKPAETRKAKTQPAPEYDAPMTSLAADRINKRKLEGQATNTAKRPKFDMGQSCDAAKRLAALLDAMPSSQGKTKTSPVTKVTPPINKSKPLAKASSMTKRPDSSATFQSYMNRIKAL